MPLALKFSFLGIVRLIAEKIGKQTKIFHSSPRLTLFLGQLIGYWVKDVIVTEDEVKGLMSNLLVSKNSPTGKTYFSQWLKQNANQIGRKYISELKLHYR